MGISDLILRTELLRMARGYWISQVLFVAHQLGIFEVLADRSLTTKEVAQACQTETRATSGLLNACTALGLLTLSDGRYRNAPIADAHLVKGREGYLGHWVSFIADLYEVWRDLEGAIRSGKPVGRWGQEKGDSRESAENFALAMHEFANGPGREFANRVDLTGRRHLLDIGGGVGSYAILLAQRYPELKATLFDMPPIIQIAKRLIAESGLSARVMTMEGDYHCQGFGSGYDAALLSNVLHQEEQATCHKILRHTFDALVPGGVVIIHDIYVNPDGAGPAWPAMQSLLQLLLWGGCVYTVDKTMELLTGAGFIGTKVLPLSLLNGGSIITAEKPAS